MTCRALFQRPNRHGPALSTVAMFADALADAAPPLPLPVSPAATAPGPTATRGYGYQPDGTAGSYPPPDAAARTQRPRTGGRTPPGQRSAAARAVVSVVIVLVLAAIGAVAWSVSHSLHRSASATPPRSHPSSPTAVAAAAVLKPVSATVYNPLGSADDDDPAEARNAIDGSTSTFWHTSYYFSPVFGDLKKGTGLVLDMGRQVRLSQLMVQFGAPCCTHVDIEIGNSNASSLAALRNFTLVQSSATAADGTTFNVTNQATGRYVLIWLTDLPQLTGNPGKYEAQIYNVIVRGYAAGQSG